MGIHQILITNDKKQKHALRAESDTSQMAWLHHLKLVTEQDSVDASVAAGVSRSGASSSSSSGARAGSDHDDDDEGEIGDALGELTQTKHGSTASASRNSIMGGMMGGNDLSAEQYNQFKEDLENGQISMIVHPRAGE